MATRRLALACVLFLGLGMALPRARAQQAPPELPLVPGMKITFAVHMPKGGPGGIAVGDYEMVVEVSSVSDFGIGLATQVEGEDSGGKPLNLRIARRVARADLAAARQQILGFHTADPAEINGTTALGPSLAVINDLKTAGRAQFSVKNFRHLSTSSGVLTRASGGPVPFSVLLNGERVDLPAIRATGQLKYGENVRPWEYLLLDHPQQPLTLRFAHGGVGAGIPFTADGTRDIVRIDYPPQLQAQGIGLGGGQGQGAGGGLGRGKGLGMGQGRLAKKLGEDCRVEVPGIYFDFNRSTLNPMSRPALEEIATLLKNQAAWRTITIEGHTDNVGTDAYNQDLSARRAATVKEALVREFGIAGGRLATAGFGESRPRETNETIAGRARNRRVELVRDCGTLKKH